VREIGCGFAADTLTSNLAASTGLMKRCAGTDFVTPRLEPAAAGGDSVRLRVPRPLGVLLAGVSPLGPVAEVYRNVLLALLTRNALVLLPDPTVGRIAGDVVRELARVAVEAGAPDGAVQVVDDPTGELRAGLATDPRVARFRAGRRAAPVPVLVDGTADLATAAGQVLAGAGFDHGLGAGRESVLIVTRPPAEALATLLRDRGAHRLTSDERDRLRGEVFPAGRFDPRFAGRAAVEIAESMGIRAPIGTRVLLAPLDRLGPEEPLAGPLPAPILGVWEVDDAGQGIRAARAVLRLGPVEFGGSAAIHSHDPQTVLAFVAAVERSQVAVNRGTGTLEPVDDPAELITWTTAAWPTGLPLPDLRTAPGLGGPVPGYPRASNL
jgi:acyl-CoA reductase-like NAD-dependent aldehyde dehydrogenase